MRLLVRVSLQCWMVQRSKNLRLTLEPRQPIRIVGKGLGQDLQRDLPVQFGIGGLVDSPMPPSPMRAVTS